MASNNIYNKFTNHFKRIITLAQNVAASLHHQQIEPLHLLYCLANEKGSIGTEVMQKNKLTPDKVRRALEILNNHQSKFQTSTKPLPGLSLTSQKIVERAVKTAFENKHKYVGTEHLLLSLAESDDPLLNEFLTEQQVSKESLVAHIKTILKSTSKFPDLTSDFSVPGGEEMERVLVDNLLAKKESALNYFAVDLTDEKVQQNIDPVIGRDQEIDRVIQILSRRTKNNPILLGDPGTGKTAIVEGLAKRILQGKVPDVLINKRILNIDLGATLAGTMYRGEFENRLKQIIEEVKKQPNIIIFVDEIHTLIGAGSASGSLDAANLLKPELARGNLRLIGATTMEEYKKHIESDAAFERRFQPVIIQESTAAETKEILQGIKKNYEKYHKVKISDEAVQAAIELSARFLPDKFLPDKAIDLLDEAAAKIKVETTKNGLGKTIKKMEEELKNIIIKKDRLILDEKFEEALKLKSQENDLLTKLSDIKKQEEKESQRILGTITRHDIAAIISRITKIPLAELVQEERDRLLQLEKTLSKYIIGQDEAVKNLAESIRRSRVGLSNPKRPIASFIFLGPSGVGKTETAKVLAKEIFESEDALIRIDMSEFAEPFNISKLIGAPAGYVGYKESGKLTDAVKRRPYSVVLFDEIEKAHPEIFNLFLPILEDGHITDAVGKKINFKNTIIIMTSNIGLTEFNQQASLGFSVTEKTEKQKLQDEYERLEEKIREGLNDTFRPEFLNRIDKIITFKPLSQEAALKIAKLQMAELTERINKQGFYLKISPPVYKQIVAKGFTAEQGARGIRKAVQDEIENMLATGLLTDELNAGDTVKLKVNKDKIVMEH